MDRPESLALRPLTVEDTTALQTLLESDPGYAERVTGSAPTPDDARDLLHVMPPGLNPAHKVVLGCFDGSELVAVVDLLRSWPTPEQVHIGLLQVSGAHQRQGLGRAAHDLLLAWVRGWPEATLLRAAIVETNAATAEPFWAALGYTAVGEPLPYDVSGSPTSVRIWTRGLR